MQGHPDVLELPHFLIVGLMRRWSLKPHDTAHLAFCGSGEERCSCSGESWRMLKYPTINDENVLLREAAASSLPPTPASSKSSLRPIMNRIPLHPTSALFQDHVLGHCSSMVRSDSPMSRTRRRSPARMPCAATCSLYICRGYCNGQRLDEAVLVSGVISAGHMVIMLTPSARFGS